MTATWAVSASDAVLAAVAIWVCVQLCRASLLQPLRWAAIFGALLIASAALVGCLRFAGNTNLLPLHTALSNQAAVIGLPLILVAVAGSRLGGWMPQRISTAAAILLLAGIAVLQSRTASGAASFFLVLATLTLSRHHRAVPLLMLLFVGTLAWLAVTKTLKNEWRLVWLHLVLAVLLPLSLAALRHTEPRRGEALATVSTRYRS